MKEFASVPLRRGVGQKRTRRSGFGVPEASRDAAHRAKRGNRTRGRPMSACRLHDLLLCVWSGEKEARRRGGSAGGREARDGPPARRRTDPSARHRVFARGKKRWRSRARGDDAHHLRHCRDRFWSSARHAVTVGARRRVRACLGAMLFVVNEKTRHVGCTPGTRCDYFLRNRIFASLEKKPIT